jgi:hypothetical protein
MDPTPPTPPRKRLREIQPPSKPAQYRGPHANPEVFETNTIEGRSAYHAAKKRLVDMGYDTRSYEEMNGRTTLGSTNTWRRPNAKGLNITGLPQE